MIAPRGQTSSCTDDLDCDGRQLNRNAPHSCRLQEALNDEAADISGHTAHALRNPLWALQLVLDGAQSMPLEDNLDMMRRSVHRMDAIIRSIESLSTLSSTRMCCCPVSLSDLARDTFDSIRETEPERNVEFRTVGSPVVMGDSEMLEILLRQVIQNAWLSTRESPDAQITFGAHTSGQLGQDDSGHLVCFLTDNGVGFPGEELLREVFAPFHSLRLEKGVQAEGMGLALARRVVHRHGGQIWAVNEPDGGATVNFSLPRAAPVAQHCTSSRDTQRREPHLVREGIGERQEARRCK